MQDNVFATDGNLIKKVSPSGEVTIFAGQITSGSTNGTGTASAFNFPTAMVTEANDNQSPGC